MIGTDTDPSTEIEGAVELDLTRHIVVIRVVGHLDGRAAPHLRKAASTIGRQPTIIDLTDVEFMDGAGLGSLLGIVHRDREAGRLTILAGAPPAVSRLLRAAGAERIAAIVPAIEDAVPAWRAYECTS